MPAPSFTELPLPNTIPPPPSQSSAVETDTVQINVAVDSNQGSHGRNNVEQNFDILMRANSTNTNVNDFNYYDWCCDCKDLFKALGKLLVPLAPLILLFLLVTPLVTSILQIMLSSEAIEKYSNNTKYQFDGSVSAEGLSMIYIGNLILSISYPVILCCIGMSWLPLSLYAYDRDGPPVPLLIMFACTLCVPSLSSVIVYIITPPIATEFYSSQLHIARMLALVTSSIKFGVLSLYCSVGIATGGVQ